MLHKMDVVFLELFCVFAGLSGYILVRINEVENGPYMDEVFHIPQVQNYCVGKFNEVCCTVRWAIIHKMCVVDVYICLRFV